MKLGWLALQRLAEINLTSDTLLLFHCWESTFEFHLGLKVHLSSAEMCSAVGSDLNKL